MKDIKELIKRIEVVDAKYLNKEAVLKELKIIANKDKTTIEQRKENFKIQVLEYAKKYKTEMLKDFYEYWTEHGVNDKKMRFEKEKAFGLSRRLSTWHNSPYNKHKKTSSTPLLDASKKIINNLNKNT